MEFLNRILEAVRNLFPGQAMADVDLATKLDELAFGTGLNWRSSVVDFLKLLNMDFSRKGRIALADELGVTEGTPGSATRNEALRTVLFKKIAENGGNVPVSLTD